MAAPTVTTQAASAILKSSLTANGTITATGGANATRRGFCYVAGAAGNPISVNELGNHSFETGTPPAGWSAAGTGASFTQSSDQSVYGTYSGKLINGDAQAASLYQAISSPEDWSEKTVVAGAWVYATVANRVRVRIGDNNGGGLVVGINSSYHTGSGWEWLEATGTLRASLTDLRVYPIFIASGVQITAYADEAIFIEGSSLGELIYSNISTSYDDGDFGAEAFTESITGLSTASPYRIRAYATNPDGTSYGATVSATTATEEPLTRAVDMCLEVVLDAGTDRYSLYGLSETYHWTGKIISFSSLRRGIPIGGGLGTVGNCTIKLADADRTFRAVDIEDYINRRVNLKLADATTGTLYQVMTGKIQDVDFDESTFSLRIRDDSYKKLKEYVSDRIVQDRTDWTNLPSTLKAALVPVLQGIVTSSNYRKTGYMPALLVDPAIGQTKYRYLACQGHATITTVFRNGKALAAGDWTQTQTNDPTATYAVTYIDCDYEQREGSDLNKDTISWDGTGPNGSATPAEAVEETLKLAGWDGDDYDTASFAAAITLYDDAPKTITAGVSVVDKDETWEDFLEYCGEQFSAQFFYNTAGKLEMIFESWEVPSATAYNYVIDDSIIQNISTQSVRESHTGLQTSYAYDNKEREPSWSRLYSDTDELTRQNSVADIGSLEIPFVYNATSADSLAYCKLKSMSSEREIITLRTAAIAGLDLGDYIKVISNFGSGTNGYEALLCKVLEIEIAMNSRGGVDYILTLVDHAGTAFPSISSSDTAGTDADVVEDSRDITTNIVFSSSAYNAVSWTAGSIKMPTGQVYSIDSGSYTGWGTDAYRYIYFNPDVSKTALQKSTDYDASAVRRGYILCTGKRSADSSSSSASMQVRYGMSDFSGSTFTGSIFQTATGNPRIRIDPTDYFQVINAGGYKVIQMDPTNYFTLRTALGVQSITMKPATGVETWDSAGLLNVRIGEPSGTYPLFVKSTGSSHTNTGFAFAQDADTVSALWWYGSTFAGKIYASSANVLTIEASDGTGAIQVVADYFESAVVSCDYLRPKTNAASDNIHVYDVAGSTIMNTIGVLTSNNDAGFSAGVPAGTRGYLAAGAQTSGTARAGVFILQNEDGDLFYLWVDTNDKLRGHTADPGANDTLGVEIADLSP